jgi:hypothetical protein
MRTDPGKRRQRKTFLSTLVFWAVVRVDLQVGNDDSEKYTASVFKILTFKQISSAMLSHSFCLARYKVMLMVAYLLLMLQAMFQPQLLKYFVNKD